MHCPFKNECGCKVKTFQTQTHIFVCIYTVKRNKLYKMNILTFDFFRNKSDDHIFLYIWNLENRVFGTQYPFLFVWAGIENTKYILCSRIFMISDVLLLYLNEWNSSLNNINKFIKYLKHPLTNLERFNDNFEFDVFMDSF